MRQAAIDKTSVLSQNRHLFNDNTMTKQLGTGFLDRFFDTLEETEEEKLRIEIEGIRAQQLQKIEFGYLNVGSADIQIRKLTERAKNQGLRTNTAQRVLDAIKTALQG